MNDKLSGDRLIEMLRSDDEGKRSTALSIVFHLARRFFFGYPIEDASDREARQVVLANSLELASAIRKISSHRAIIFDGLIGNLCVSDATRLLLNCRDKRECSAIIEALSGRDSLAIRIGLQRAQRIFTEDRSCWVTATFALYQRCREVVDANALRNRASGWPHSYKAVQVIFRLAIDGDPAAKLLCQDLLNEGKEMGNLTFETMCWFNCSRIRWKDYFDKYVIGCSQVFEGDIDENSV